MKEIKLKALVGDEVYFLYNDFTLYIGKVTFISIDYSGKIEYTMAIKRQGSEIIDYVKSLVVGISKEDLIEELTKLINECVI